MKTLILIAFSIALAAGLARADGEDLIGVWEAEDGDQVLVFEFREDGIMIENDYDEGELQCVYVSPYSADGDVVTVGSGLNWEVDPDTGKLVLYEDYENEEIEFIYRANGNDLELPLDVAALGDELRSDGVGVQLVNMSAGHTRRVVMQSGAFGKHTFTHATFRRQGDDGETTIRVDGKHFTMELPPSPSMRVYAGLNRHANTRSYAFPWHGDKIPVPYD